MGDTVTIRLRDSWEDYHLIPIREDVREFFPPYKERFTLIIEDDYIRTNVTGRTSTEAEKGNPEAGTYLREGIGGLAQNHPEIYGGDTLTIEKISSDKYKILDW